MGVTSFIEHFTLRLVCPSAASGQGRLKGTATAKVIGTQQGTTPNPFQEIGLPGLKGNQAAENVEHVQ